MLLPVFVKGHLIFHIEGKTLEFIHQNISAFGVMGLPWAPLNPRDHFGAKVEATVRIPNKPALVLKTQGQIMREATLQAQHMGLRFFFAPEQKAKLSELIAKNGFYPTEYLRKYPRIPSSDLIQTFPQRVLATPVAPGASPSDQIAFEVGNLSPNGVLMHTESPFAIAIRPGAKLELTFEPRGWFPLPIQVLGMVCRTIDEIDPDTGHSRRYLGIRFQSMDETNRTAFLDLLKDILVRLKKQGPA